MFCSSVTYNFPLEDNFSEDVTLVGNNKGWQNGTTAGAIDCTVPGWAFAVETGAFPNNDDAPIGTGGINRRENLSFAPSSAQLADSATGVDYTRLPSEIPGVDANGWMSPRRTPATRFTFKALLFQQTWVVKNSSNWVHGSLMLAL